jgi:hypothetical protein
MGGWVEIPSRCLFWGLEINPRWEKSKMTEGERGRIGAILLFVVFFPPRFFTSFNH